MGPQRAATAALSMALAGCSSSAPPGDATPADETALVPAKDENTDPAIVEVNLEAREATKSYGAASPTKVWTYNGSIPGPLIEAKVGDRLVVHFKNRLPAPTTIHWHGVRLPATMDGTLAMQSPIPPGGAFEYAFTLRDAGLYWFHPHIRSDIQIHKGLYGVIRVRGADEPAVDDERIVVLDDVRLSADGSLSEVLDDESKMMGREGKTLLLNGLASPTLRFRPGALVRLRVLNVANGRFFNIRLPGVVWKVIGTDGSFVSKPYDAERVLVAPGERYDLLFVAPTGDLTLTNDPYDRGHDSGREPAAPLATFKLEGQAVTGKTVPPSLRAPERLPDGPTDIAIALNEKITPAGELVFTVNDAVYPNVAPFTVNNASVHTIDLKNDSEMDHPFHLHGFFFQPIARNGMPLPAEALVNKDTIVVPMKSTLKLVARFDEPGKWMYHCHVLEHAEAGMMGEVHVK